MAAKWYLFHAFDNKRDAKIAARKLWDSRFAVSVREFGGKFNVYTMPQVPHDAAAWNKYKR